MAIMEYFFKAIVAIKPITRAAPFHAADGKPMKSFRFQLSNQDID